MALRVWYGCAGWKEAVKLRGLGELMVMARTEEKEMAWAERGGEAQGTAYTEGDGSTVGANGLGGSEGIGGTACVLRLW